MPVIKFVNNKASNSHDSPSIKLDYSPFNNPYFLRCPKGIGLKPQLGDNEGKPQINWIGKG